MFKELLIDFMEEYGQDFDLHQAQSVCQEVVRYHVLGDTWLMRRTLRNLTDKETAALIEKKVVSRFWQNGKLKAIWRAVMAVIYNGQTVEEVATAHHVSEEDLRYEIDLLSDEQVKEICAKAKKEKWLFEPMDFEKYEALSASLYSNAKTLAYKKLHFLCVYDRGLCMDDMIAELWMEGCRNLHNRWHFKYETSRLRFARRAMANKAIDLIKFYTDAARAKIVGEEVEPVEGQPTTFKEFERRMTTLSLDRPVEYGSKGGVLTLHNKCSYDIEKTPLRQQEYLENTYDSLEIITEGLTPDQEMFVRIVACSHVPEDFETFVREKYKKPLEAMIIDNVRPTRWKGKRKPKSESYERRINYQKLARLACRWLKLSENEIKETFRPLLIRGDLPELQGATT